MKKAKRLELPSKSRAEQLEGKATWNQDRSTEMADFFTCGYTGRKFDELLQSLQSAGVQCLIDIRQHAVSMYRPELSKKNLARELEANGIQYLHFPELGVPRDVRANAIKAGTRDPIWEWYDEYVVGLLNLNTFLNFANHPVALMCVETDPTECHRHRLSIALEDMGLRGYDL